VAAAAATLGLAILIAVQGWRVVALHWETDKRTGVMGWPMVWVTVSLPLGMVLICWRHVRGWWAYWRRSHQKKIIAQEEQ
jgi:TRAP-type C4-dicarboxylate transport system permease small subunit